MNERGQGDYMIDSTLQALCDMADTIRIQRAVVDDVSRRQRAVIEPMRANLVRVVDDVSRRQRAVIEPMRANLVRVVNDVARRQQAYKLVERRPAREAGMMLLYRREPAVHPCRHEIREPVRRKIGF